MEEDGIGLVLARAYELRMKFTNCIQKATRSDLNGEERGAEDKEGSVEADDEEAESLLNIRDALESLESQLSSLQVGIRRLSLFFNTCAFAFPSGYYPSPDLSFPESFYEP